MTSTPEPKTELEKLIEAERKKAAAKIAKLKRDAAAEQRKVDAKVVELLQTQSADLYKRLAKEAKTVLAAARAERSAKAKWAAGEPAAETVAPAVDTNERSEEVRQPWNG